jgi:hypothetical protein
LRLTLSLEHAHSRYLFTARTTTKSSSRLSDMAAPRLPTVVQPLHYDLLIRTDLAPSALSFSGLVKITLRAHESTSVIVLNAAPSLNLGQASVISTAIDHSAEQRAVYTSHDTPLERVTLHFEKPLKAGEEYVLSIAFCSKLSAKFGYSYSTVILEGKPVHYSSTLFEVCTLIRCLCILLTLITPIPAITQPISARTTFPCFDEPALKATFSISLVSRPGLVNVSNMPIVHEGPLPSSLEGQSYMGIDTPERGLWNITTFGRTPPVGVLPMSSCIKIVTAELCDDRCRHILQHGHLARSRILKAHTRALYRARSDLCEYTVNDHALPLPFCSTSDIVDNR